jgi:hypothetical protein
MCVWVGAMCVPAGDLFEPALPGEWVTAFLGSPGAICRVAPPGREGGYEAVPG